MSMIAKLNRNLQRYGIEMMNGQSTGLSWRRFSWKWLW